MLQFSLGFGVNHAHANHTFANLGGRFGFFVFFSAGEGKGVRGSRKGVGGVRFLLKIPGEGVSQERGGGGAEGSGGCLRGIWGGGGKYIFFGAEMPTK